MTPAPLLLTAPSAWRGRTRGGARVLLALLVLLAIAAAGLAGAPSGNDARPAFALDTGLVEGVRHGDGYYNVAADLVRGGGTAARPLVGVRLPTLTAVTAPLPAPVVSALLATLALATALAWYERLAPALSRSAARLAAVVLLLAGVAASFRQEAAVTAETWAGLFVALALARWRPGRATEAIGWALAAALIDERAALAIVVMASFAWIGLARREAAGWMAALAVLAVVVAVHRHAIDMSGIAFADTPADPAGSLGGMIADLGAATALASAPVSIAAASTVLGFAGWGAWRDPLAPRVLAVVLGFLAVGLVSSGGGAPMAAPLSLAGLLFLPDGVRDLGRAALDRRRIVVRRVPR